MILNVLNNESMEVLKCLVFREIIPKYWIRTDVVYFRSEKRQLLHRCLIARETMVRLKTNFFIGLLKSCTTNCSKSVRSVQSAYNHFRSDLSNLHFPFVFLFRFYYSKIWRSLFYSENSFQIIIMLTEKGWRRRLYVSSL